MTEIVVHGAPASPYVRGVLMALEEKQVPWRLAPMTLAEIQSTAHRRRHVFGRVPVIDDGGVRLYEAQAIHRYLDARFPEPRLQPADPRRAARMNQVAGIVDWYLFPQVTMTITWHRRMPPAQGSAPDEAAIAAALPQARACIAELARLRGRRRYMVGPALSIADLLLAPHLDGFAHTPEGAALLDGSPLLAWLEVMRQRPSMAATGRERLVTAL